MAVTVNVLATNGYDLETIPDEIKSRDPSDLSTPGLFVLIGAPGGGHISFLGSGFTYDAQGYPTAGTVTGFNIATGVPGSGTRLVEVRGLNLSAANLSSAIRQIKDFDNPFAFYGLFANTSQTITGGPGNDVLVPLSDGLVGANHSISGGAGNDTITGGRGADTLNGGAGDDTIQSDPEFAAGAGGSRYDGGGNTDTLEFFGGNFATGLGPAVDLRITGAQDTGSHGILTLLGLENVSAAFSFASNLIGNAVDNILRGSVQADTMRGGLGNDTLLGDAGDDDLFGEAGRDTVQGGAGNDLVAGGIDNDVLSGQDGIDSLLGQAGNDRMFGGLGNDVMQGQDGDDTLLGEAGNDRLFGGNGIDLLNGGSGADRLAGGAGGDGFTFTAAGFGADIVVDWQDGADTLRFRISGLDSVSDFTIQNNNTANVTVTPIGNFGGSIALSGPAPFVIDAFDFIFLPL